MIAERTLTIEDIFNDWIQRAESEETKKAYTVALNEFIKHVFYVKDISEVSVEQWCELTPMDVRTQYVTKCQAAGKKNSTIKQQLRKVDSFVSHMSKFKEISSVVDIAYIKTACLETKYMSDDTTPRAKMADNEVFEFINWLKYDRFTGRHAELGEKYAIATEFMFKTATRSDAVFGKVKWCDIRWESDSYHNYGYNAYILSKGNKVAQKAIPEKLYEKMYETFFNGDLKEGIFKSLSAQMFARLTKEFGELKGIEYTPHSIKIGSVTAFYDKTKDLVRTMEFADHEDPRTTLGYIRLNNNRMEKGGVVLSLEVDKDKMRNSLSAEQLWAIISRDDNLSMVIAREAESRCYAENLLIET